MSKKEHIFKELGHHRLSDVSADKAYLVEQFYYLEAELLDSWEFERWLTLFSEDIHYWAPVRENRSIRDLALEVYPEGTAAHFDEDYRTLCQRVRRLLSARAWSESPPSRTRHIVTNIRVYQADGSEDEYDVESTIYVYRTSSEKNEDWIVGKRFDRLKASDLPCRFVITKRTVIFDMSTILIKNLSSFY